MQGIKPFKLGFLTRPFSVGRKHHLGVSVLGFFSLDAPGQLFTDVEMWDLVAKELGGTTVDVGIPKSRAEALVTGACFVPGGRRAHTCPVSFRIGALERRIHVIGDRFWLRDTPTEPRSFRRMPIDWSRAYGGEGFERNPLGRGFAPITDDKGREVHPLPNLAAPGEILRSPKDRPEPVSFGPVDFMWPQRFSMAGTYDAKWLETRYPGFAEDLDWRMWNLAQPAQQRDAFFKGDEPIHLENLHPEIPHLESRLPGVRARAFVTRTREGQTARGALEEIELRLSTVWLFPHMLRGIVIFQGGTQVVEDDAADIETIMVAAERLDAPRPFAHYEGVIERRLGQAAKENPAVHLEDDDLMPPGATGLSPETQRQMELLQAEGLQAKHLRARQAAEVAAARDKVAALGLDPDEHAPPAMDPEAPEEAPPQLHELGKKLEELMALKVKMQAEAEVGRERELASMEKLYQELGLDFDEVREELRSPPGGPPTFSADAVRAQLQKMADDSAKLGYPIDEVEHYATDPGWEKHLRWGESEMVAAYRMGAHHQGPAAPMETDRALRLRGEVEEAVRRGESLARRDFTGADLSEMRLANVDLSNAFLESANLERADLRGARLDGAVLAHANLSGAELDGASLGGTNLGRANMAAARLEGVDLSKAVLWGTDLRAASLRGSRLDGAMLLELKLEHADLSGASFDTTFFLEIDLRGCRFTGARLPTAVFYRAQLGGVDFGGAHLDDATFMDCNVDRASFVNAHMHGVRCMGTAHSWNEVDFRGAQLVKANYRGVPLHKADFSGACLDKADLSEAKLREARFYRAVARDSMWVKADLRQAFMVSADLLRAIMQKADLRGTDLRGANLYAADFALIRSDRGTNVTDAIQGKVRTAPRREGR